MHQKNITSRKLSILVFDLHVASLIHLEKIELLSLMQKILRAIYHIFCISYIYFSKQLYQCLNTTLHRTATFISHQ